LSGRRLLEFTDRVRVKEMQKQLFNEFVVSLYDKATDRGKDGFFFLFAFCQPPRLCQAAQKRNVGILKNVQKEVRLQRMFLTMCLCLGQT
jgi:hypothetical protein